MNDFLDNDFLVNYIQHTNDVITIPSFGSKQIKIKKLSADQTRVMGGIIINEFGKEKFEKYYNTIQSISGSGLTDIQIERKLKELMGEDYEKFSDATMKSVIYKVACSTGLDLELISELDQVILIQLSEGIDKAFTIKSDEDLKKK
jgi:hypothetical protein